MRKKKMKKMFIEIMDERFEEYQGKLLWQKVIDTENKMETLRADLNTWTPVINSLNNHPALNNLAGRK